MTYNGTDTVILNRTEQHILKDTITKFIFGPKTLDLCLYIIKYRAEPTLSPFRVFKKAEAYINMLNAKTHIQKKLDLKSGYEAFKTFQTSIAHSYGPVPCKVYSYQPSLLH